MPIRRPEVDPEAKRSAASPPSAHTPVPRLADYVWGARLPLPYAIPWLKPTLWSPGKIIYPIIHFYYFSLQKGLQNLQKLLEMRKHHWTREIITDTSRCYRNRHLCLASHRHFYRHGVVCIFKHYRCLKVCSSFLRTFLTETSTVANLCGIVDILQVLWQRWVASVRLKSLVRSVQWARTAWSHRHCHRSCHRNGHPIGKRITTKYYKL